MNFQPGSKIGDYEVLGTLGAGGMGRVYKVRNDLSDRVEAMKILLPDLEGHADLANRFLREIKVQAGLDHPNIAKLYTALRIENQLLMCMELVEGITLDERLKQGPIPLVDSLDYMVQVLRALEYAHQRGVVHRDIKPANMMLLPDGRLKLLDFGIAKASIDNRLTVTGTTLGSLYYMSPEQIQGGQVDVRSDVYSVGVSLYELVTGKKPFDAESQFAIMSAHLARAPVPPLELSPGLLPAVSETILVALAKEPAQRFQTAGEFLLALREVQEEIGFGAGTSLDAQPVKPAGTRLRLTSVPVPPPLERTPVPPPVQSAPPKPAAPPTPVPLPEAAPRHVPTPVEQDAPPQKKGGPRLMWVAIGSVCAVAAIIAFIQLGPKGQSSSKESPAGAFTPTYPQNTPAKPSAMPPAGSRPAVAAPAAENRKQTPAQRKEAQDQARQAAPPQAPPQSSPSAAAPAAVEQPAPANPPVAGSPPGIASANRSEVQKVNERLGVIYGRARTVRDALMELQKTPDGARTDLVDSFNRMNAYLKQATAGVNDGNAATASDAMLKAEHELLNLEKALNK